VRCYNQYYIHTVNYVYRSGIAVAIPRDGLYAKTAHSDEATMRPAAVKLAKPPRDNITAFAEFPAPALAVAAVWTIPEGADPSIIEAPHSDCSSLFRLDDALGKSSLKILYASLTQLEHVTLDGMLVVLAAFTITAPILLMLRVPKTARMLVRVCVMQFVFVPESERQRIFLAVG